MSSIGCKVKQVSKGVEYMNEVMSVKEINSQFESEWVLLEDPETTETLEVKSGKVLWHCKDRDELYRILGELLKSA